MAGLCLECARQPGREEGPQDPDRLLLCVPRRAVLAIEGPCEFHDGVIPGQKGGSSELEVSSKAVIAAWQALPAHVYPSALLSVPIASTILRLNKPMIALLRGCESMAA